MSGTRLTEPEAAAPALTTRRLVLRPLALADAAAVEALCGRDFEVVRWLTSPSWPYEDGASEAYLAQATLADPVGGKADFAITLGGVMIGVVAISAEKLLPDTPAGPSIGYWIGRPFQGFGYGTEAVAAACEWAFEAGGVQALAARVFTDNPRSQRLLARLGFRQAGHMTSWSRPLGHEKESLVMRCDRNAFARPAAAA